MSVPLLDVRDLTVSFARFIALEGVSFTVEAGEAVGLVGESGSGKSTLARTLLRLKPAQQGSVRFRGIDVLGCDARTLRDLRRDLQIVFQDPLSSLDPRMTVGRTLAEPLEIHTRATRARRELEVTAMLEKVGLTRELADRFPHELSGGQCQRVAVARAMMLNPQLLVCDEPVSALDVSIQGQIVNLLADLNREQGTALLFISHHLAVVRHLCRRVIVMLAGRVLEIAETRRLFESPAHPYTRALIAAVPVLGAAPGPRARPSGAPARPSGAPTHPSGSPTHSHGPPDREGCVYRDRCGYATQLCARARPALEPAAAGQLVACHRWREILA